jgi:MOSC domain-containing protein YiiM
MAGAEPRCESVAVLEAGRGIVGDRYYEHRGTFSEKLRPSQDWEVTLIEQEEIERFCAAEGRPLEAGVFRRNIVTAGVRLNDLVGHQFRVGEALLEGVRLCEPCAHLATWLGPGVLKAMAHRAGIRARVISGARVRPGDAVVPYPVRLRART